MKNKYWNIVSGNMFKGKFCILLAVMLSLSTLSAADEDNMRDLSCEELSETLSHAEYMVHYGGLIINPGDTLFRSVAVIDGSLDIQSGGVLVGDAWVVNGRVVLTGRARVHGSLNLVNTDEYISRLSVVTGESNGYRSECELNYDKYQQENKVSFRKIENPASLHIEQSVKPGTPSRVDYNILKLGLKRYNPKHEEPYISFESHLHIPIWKEEGGFLGFDAEISIPVIHRSADIFLRGFKITDTNDDWQLSRMENGVIAVLSGDDFADYYERRGVEAGLLITHFNNLEIKPSISYQSDVSLSARPIPSLLHTHDKFRENPGIESGKRLAARVDFSLNSRDDTGWTYGGWTINLIFEKGIADGPGDFSYSVLDLDVARFNQISRSLKIDFRGKMFTSFGRIPEQLNMTINGYGGIRGLSNFPFTPYRGDRLALFTVELRKSIPEIPLLRRVCSSMDLLFFSDSGILENAEDPDAPLDFLKDSGNKWKSTLGLGITARSILPCVGFYIAEDTGSETFSPRFILRAERSF